MQKPRAPIATRLRSKVKTNKEHSLSQNEEASLQSETKKSSAPRDNNHEKSCSRNKGKHNPESLQNRTDCKRGSSQECSKTEDDDSLLNPSTSIEENFPFLPRKDPGIYMDELHSPLSFVRGTTRELNKFLRKEQEVLSNAFGNKYNPSIKISAFYQAQLSPPVPSKRTSHQSTKQQRKSRVTKKLKR